MNILDVDENELNSEIDKLKTNIFAYFPLKNDGKDYSERKLQTTSTPTVKFISGRQENGNAADLTSDGAFITLNIDQEYHFDDYTISCWVNVSSSMSDDYGTIIGDLAVSKADGHVRLNFNYSTVDKNNNPLPVKKICYLSHRSLSIDEWHHVIVTYNHYLKQLVFYIDGEQDAVYELSFVIPDNCSILLPISNKIGGKCCVDFKGLISDVFILTTAVNSVGAKFLEACITDEKYIDLIGKKRFFPLTVVLFGIILCELTVFVILENHLPTPTPAPPKSKTTRLDIIGISDLHGRLQSINDAPVAAAMTTNIKDITSNNENGSVVIGIGDLYTGTPLSLYNCGQVVMDVMDNYIQMDVCALGNHEFDWGLDNIVNKKPNKKYYLCANLLKKNQQPIQNVQPYTIISRKGIKIAIIGAISEDIFDLVPKEKNNYDVSRIVDSVNYYAKLAKNNDKANIVIAAIHEGTKDINTGCLNSVVNELSEVDFVFGGHSHNPMNFGPDSKSGSSVRRVYISEENGVTFIHLQISYDIETRKIDSYIGEVPINNPNLEKVDEGVKKVVSDGRELDEVKKYYEPPTDYKIKINQELLIPKESNELESLAGNFITDLLRTFDHKNIDFVFFNNGGLRQSIPKTENLLKKDIYYLLPFNNYLIQGKMSGSSIKDVLEHAVEKNTVDEIKKYGLQVSGLKFIYDTSQTSKDRVLKIYDLNNNPINPTSTYTIRIPDYLYYGGDRYPFVDKITESFQVSVNNICDIIFNNRSSAPSNVKIDGRIVNANKFLSEVNLSMDLTIS